MFAFYMYPTLSVIVGQIQIIDVMQGLERMILMPFLC